jgi:hypothetical protein
LSEEGYEGEFTEKLSELEVKIKCPNGHEFSDTIFYEGIVESSEREMGNELHHVWKNEEITCPTCGEELTVKLGV